MARTPRPTLVPRSPQPPNLAPDFATRRAQDRGALAFPLDRLKRRGSSPLMATNALPIRRIPRRPFLRHVAVITLGGSGLVGATRAQTAGAPVRKRKLTMDLACGSIGVSANQLEAIELAHRFGFESVGADGGYLAALPEDKLAALLADLKAKNLVWGAAGLPVDFRGSQATFDQGLGRLPAFAAGLRRAGVTRVGTWLSPAHDRLTYLQNFRQHTVRLRAVAQALQEHGVRLGIEYVGPKTSWTRGRYPFVHTMAEMKELIAEISVKTVGFVLDSWHWYTAGETAADLQTLRPEDIVAVDLNDAPAGVPVDQQSDGRRELPAATGVIDLATFLNALNTIGYDGPVRAEPFNQALNRLGKEEACAATAQAMRKAFALIQE